VFSFPYFEYHLFHFISSHILFSDETEGPKCSMEFGFLDNQAIVDRVGGGELQCQVSILQVLSVGIFTAHANRRLHDASDFAALARPFQLFRH
jgi:hypothetical protein